MIGVVMWFGFLLALFAQGPGQFLVGAGLVLLMLARVLAQIEEEILGPEPETAYFLGTDDASA